jgi:hypothetical protein
MRSANPAIDNKPGIVFSTDEKHCKFDKDSQQWHSLGARKNDGTIAKPGDPEAINFWVGWSKFPEPESIQRAEIVPGHRASLRGKNWIIPMAREWTLETGRVLYDVALPRQARFDIEMGRWTAGEIELKYRHLFDHATAIYEAFTNQDAGKFTLPDNALEICSSLIETNYRIGPEEISHLGLLNFSFDSVWSVLKLLIDEPGLNEVVKKKALSESS